ncbi:MAG: hypothetical protein H7222_06240 [Methylotenera sp.]|nr:hypothetical protein [Oligoflexia bacterium]
MLIRLKHCRLLLPSIVIMAFTISNVCVAAQSETQTECVRLVSPEYPKGFTGRSGTLYSEEEVIKTLYYGRPEQPVYKIHYVSKEQSFWLVTHEDETTRDIYELQELTEPKMAYQPGPINEFSQGFKWNSHLDKEGYMHVSVQTGNFKGERSEYLNAANEYDKTLEYFNSSTVKGISAVWPSDWALSDNLSVFNECTAPPKSLSPQEAVWHTHEGTQAKRLGFTKITFSDETLLQLSTKKPGEYRDVRVVFSKP